MLIHFKSVDFVMVTIKKGKTDEQILFSFSSFSLCLCSFALKKIFFLLRIHLNERRKKIKRFIISFDKHIFCWFITLLCFYLVDMIMITLSISLYVFVFLVSNREICRNEKLTENVVSSNIFKLVV